ncbi:alpha/beta hydrolase family protein [Pseudoalteromonas obscura]|uniref:Prolyl oligopeptidase family serine peptidase n=1 Tax=Pseudoalteromonas obscura TaxID=3048491 RepID=A0ABT7ER14_9GAMM|nr:prolyl oligopeptidase family serine peptidase [Pseudoalteromonas sp. P94(2023)]MDK2597433.1 prolyl oligopeptidase family serine peptidase [Pseudoalteromonas sp. P94(2023)]
MRIGLLLKLFVLCGVLISNNANASNIELPTSMGIKNQHSCFHDVFSDYDSWFKFVYAKNESNFKRRGIKDYSKPLKQFEKRFNTMFPKTDFDAAKKALDCQRFTYSVNGQEVDGLLIAPKKMTSTQSKVPVVLYNRGGTRNYGDLVFGHVVYSLFPVAMQGYAVIASNYRKDEQYGADNIDEVTRLIDIVENIPQLESNKVNVYGASRGGLTSMQLARERPNKIASIVSVAGVMNSELWAQNRAGIRNNISLIDGYTKNAKAIHNKLSPVQWVDELPNVPVLLMHSKDDTKVSVKHSLQMVEKLKQHDRPHKAIIFPDGGHDIIGYKDKALNHTIQWFKSAAIHKPKNDSI